jgi:hypothetical protein
MHGVVRRFMNVLRCPGKLFYITFNQVKNSPSSQQRDETEQLKKNTNTVTVHQKCQAGFEVESSDPELILYGAPCVSGLILDVKLRIHVLICRVTYVHLCSHKH